MRPRYSWGEEPFWLRLRTLESDIPILGGDTRGFDRNTAYTGVSLMPILGGDTRGFDRKTAYTGVSLMPINMMEEARLG